MERAMRIELTYQAWEARVLPLNYARIHSKPLYGTCVGGILPSGPELSNQKKGDEQPMGGFRKARLNLGSIPPRFIHRIIGLQSCSLSHSDRSSILICNSSFRIPNSPVCILPCPLLLPPLCQP